MSRYRKFEVRTWSDSKFRSLSQIPPCGQGLWFFLLTGPHTGPIPGLFRAGRASLAEELSWSVEAFDKAFGEVFAQGMAKADFNARLIWLPKALKHNKPESPNVVRSWRSEFDLLPECELKTVALAGIKSLIYELGEGYRKAFEETFEEPSQKASSKTMPNQDQDQDQDQDQERERRAHVPRGTAGIVPAGASLTEISAESLLDELLDVWRRDVPECNPEAFTRWIVHCESRGKQLGSNQRLYQARQLAGNGTFDDQKTVVDYCIGKPYYSLIPLSTVQSRLHGTGHGPKSPEASKAQRESAESAKLRELMDSRTSLGMSDFRDAHPLESATVYESQLRLEESRRKRERPAVASTLAAAKRMNA